MNDYRNLTALDELGDRLAVAERKESARKRSVRGRLALASAGLVALFAITPPGQSLAGDVGELLGIGEESTVQHAGNEADSVVLAEGEAPGGTPYEVAAYTTYRLRQAPGPDRPGAAGLEVDETSLNGELCFSLDLSGPNVPERPTGGVCFTSNNIHEDIERDSFSAFARVPPPAFQPETELMVQGHASSRVHSVDVHYQRDGATERAAVELVRLTSAQAEAIGSPRVGAAFFAFLPSGVFEEDPSEPGVLTPEAVESAVAGITVTAYDAEGGELREGGLFDRAIDVLLIDHPPKRFPNTPSHEHVLKQCALNPDDCEIEPTEP